MCDAELESLHVPRSNPGMKLSQATQTKNLTLSVYDWTQAESIPQRQQTLQFNTSGNQYQYKREKKEMWRCCPEFKEWLFPNWCKIQECRKWQSWWPSKSAALRWQTVVLDSRRQLWVESKPKMGIIGHQLPSILSDILNGSTSFVQAPVANLTRCW